MAIRTLLKFRNPDSTADINDRFRGTFSKGVITGGAITPVSGILEIDLEPFSTAGSDGMFVRESTATRLNVLADDTTFIVIKQEYIANADPVVLVESMSQLEFENTGEPGEQGFDNPTLIVFGTVTLAAGAISVVSTDIDYTQANRIDPLGRIALRGVIADSGSLPPAGSNANRPGDFYVVADGLGGYPSLWAWNGVNWVNMADISAVLDLMQRHAGNLIEDQKHLTEDQASAMESTTGVGGISELVPPEGLSDGNRVVSQKDTRFPSQDEKDALAGNYVDTDSLESAPPSDVNRYITSSKVFSAPTELAFTSVPPVSGSSSSVELGSTEGPFFVGLPTDPEAVPGTAQRYFNVYGPDVAGDSAYLNSEFQSVQVTGVYLDAGLTQEVDPGTADSLGFVSSSLYLKCFSVIDTASYRIAYGKKTSLGDLLPHLLMTRGPQGSQIDSTLAKLASGSAISQFSDSTWGSGVVTGDIVAFNPSTSKLVGADPNSGLYPIGVRGNSNNLISDGLLTSALPIFQVNTLYADKTNPGGVTTTPNEWLIGRAISATQLIVNVNQLPLTSSGETTPPVVFPPTLFVSGLQPGQVAAYIEATNKFDIADPTDGLRLPVGIRGSSDNIIQNGLYQALSGNPFNPGQKYYAGSAGQLVTAPNDWLIGEAISSTDLLVNVNQEAIPRAFYSEHQGGTGHHKLPYGNQATRDAIATPAQGMLFLRTDTVPPRIDTWNGSVWAVAAGEAPPPPPPTMPVGAMTAWTGGTTMPTDGMWLPADGALYDKSSYPDLWSLYSDGGDPWGSNATQFRTPDLGTRMPVGYKGGDSDFGVYGQDSGAKTVTLATSEIPLANDHITAGVKTGGPDDGDNRGSGSSLETHASNSHQHTINHNHSHSYAPSAQSHSNLQPSVTVMYIIKALS